MDRIGAALMMMKVSYAGEVGRLSPGDIADARRRLSAELEGRDDPDGRARLMRFCDRLDEARHDRDALAAVARELRDWLRSWSRPDPVDIDRRDIHG